MRFKKSPRSRIGTSAKSRRARSFRASRPRYLSKSPRTRTWASWISSNKSQWKESSVSWYLPLSMNRWKYKERKSRKAHQLMKFDTINWILSSCRHRIQSRIRSAWTSINPKYRLKLNRVQLHQKSQQVDQPVQTITYMAPKITMTIIRVCSLSWGIRSCQSQRIVKSLPTLLLHNLGIRLLQLLSHHRRRRKSLSNSNSKTTNNSTWLQTLGAKWGTSASLVRWETKWAKPEQATWSSSPRANSWCSRSYRSNTKTT